MLDDNNSGDEHIIKTESVAHELREMQILNDPITENDALQAIGKLKNDSSPGYDNIVNKYIKGSINILCNLYVKIFNRVSNTGYLPEEWLIWVLVPLYKNKGDADESHTYRGIALLNCLDKLFTSLINDRGTHFSNRLDTVKETQAGFRQGYSTLDQIFLLRVLSTFFYEIGTNCSVS